MDELVIPQVVGDELYAPPPEGTTVDNVAANRAMTESAILGDGSFNERFQAYRTTSGGIAMDAGLERIADLNKESKIAELVADETIPVEKKLEAISFEADKIGYNKLSPYDEFLFQILRQEGGGLVTMDRVQRMYEETPASALRALSDLSRERQLSRMRQDVNDVAASNGWGNMGEAITEVGMQDFIPIFNIATRIGFNDAMAEAAGVDLNVFESLMPGSARARMREAFIEMSPQEFTEAVSNMEAEVSRLQQHPVYGPMLTKYAILEHWSAVFSEDVLTQQDAIDNWDKWGGNLEVALEGLLGVGMIAYAGGKTMRNAFRTSDASKLKQTALTVRNGEAVTKLNNAISEAALEAKLQIQSGEATANNMPKPTQLLDDVEYAPDNIRQIVANNERLRSELLDTPTNAGNSLLDVKDQARVVKEELALLDEFDGAVVHSRMSTLNVLEDGSGIEVNAVFGATPSKGWTDFEDVLIEALDLDPDLRQLDIMYVNDKGTLSKLDISTEEFRTMVIDGEMSLSRTGDILGGEEFFLRYRSERPWHPMDARLYESQDSLSSAVGNFVFTPNAKFDARIYDTFAKAALDEQRTVAILNQMSNPYQTLGVADKKMANHIFEWGEQFGRTQRRNPTYAELSAAHPDASKATLEGVIAMRNTMDTMYDMLNQRVFYEFKANGFQTAKPVDPTLPTYHGKVQVRADDVPTGPVLDPVSGELVNLTKRQINEIYDNGGSVMTDLPISVKTNTPGEKVTRVILSPDQYRTGALSEKPLRYHAGYTMRFYDDPYYVVKVDDAAKVDGKKDPIGGSEAVRTAGTVEEANRWITRANRAMERRGKTERFQVIRGSDIEQNESSLLQKQVLQQEGRLFYDERNYDVLPAVGGGRAEIEDPGIALERGIHLASRQLTNEDPIRGLKEAWTNEYGRLVKNGALNRPGVSLKSVESELSQALRNAPDIEARKRIRSAREYIRYMRLMEGTNSLPVSWTRAQLVAIGQGLHRFLGVGNKRNRFFRAWDKTAGQAEPLRLIRSVAFNLFMKLRPVRQFIMQSAQVGFLAAIDPAYVTTGRVFKDMAALQFGRTAIREGTDISEKALAKMMGLPLNEYRILVKNFERSGLIDTVDVHTFTGKTAAQARPTKLPTGNPLSGAAYHTRRAGGAVLDTAGLGFTKGESNNLAGTYMIALRRYLKRNDKTISTMDAGDWDKLRIDTSNLALAMIKPNNMRYQTGMLSAATQFLSFTHKAALALIGRNPSMTGWEAFRLWVGGLTLYGAEYVGMSEFVGSLMAANELEHVGPLEIPGTNDTVENWIKYGLLETMFNGMANLTTDDWQDLDISFLSPGPDLKSLYEMTLVNLITSPMTAFFGPTASIGNRTWKAMQYVEFIVNDTEMPAQDKLSLSMTALATGTVPFINDVYASWLGAVHDQWYTSSGEPLGIETEFNSLWARGTFGIRSRAETNRWAIEGAIFENEDNRRQIVKGYKDHFNKLFTDYYDRTITEEVMEQQVKIVANIINEWPDGAKANILERIFTEDFEDGRPSLVDRIATETERGTFDPVIYDAIDEMGLPPGEASLVKEMIRDAYGKTVKREPELRERLLD